jgi:hypothetical protein
VLLKAGLEHLDLPENSLVASLTDSGEIELVCPGFRGSSVSLKITLKGGSASYLQAPEELVVPLSKRGSFLLSPRKLETDDPFDSHYALTLTAPGTVGQASFLFGECQEEALAVLKDANTVLYSARVRLGRRPFRVVFHCKKFDLLSLPGRSKVFLTFDLIPPS